MAKQTPGPKTVFVISPIGSQGTEDYRRYRLALDYIVKRALPSPDWDVKRADDEDNPDSIGVKVIERIVQSDLIVANLTDHRANVFYELAVAHGHGKPVVPIMEAGQKPPFDVIDQRAIFYDLRDLESVDDAQKRLTAAALHALEPEFDARNPLTSFGAFKAISDATASGEVGDAVAHALGELTTAVGRIGRRLDRIESQSAVGRAWTSSTYHKPISLAGSMSSTDLVKTIADLEVALTRIPDGPTGAGARRALRRERAQLLQELVDRKRSNSDVLTSSEDAPDEAGD